MRLYVRPRIRSQRPRAGRPGPSQSPSRPERLPAVVPEERIQRHSFTPQWILPSAAVAPTTPSLYTRMLISLWAARSKMSLAATLQVILSVSKNMSLWRRCPALFTPGAAGQKQLEGNRSNRRRFRGVPCLCSYVCDSASSFWFQRPETLPFFFFFFAIYTLGSVARTIYQTTKIFTCRLDKKQRRGEITDFCTFCEDQSCTVRPLGDVFEPLWAVIQRKHSRHVGQQSLEVRGQTGHMRTTLFVCLFVWYWGEEENQSFDSYLCSADVAGRLVSANVLLSGLQGQAIHLLTGRVPERSTRSAFNTQTHIPVGTFNPPPESLL